MVAAIDVDIAAAIDRALDGRPVMWLAEKTGIKYHNLRRSIYFGRPFAGDELARIRAALPTLPPPPEPASNGHGNGTPAEDGGAMPGPS